MQTDLSDSVGALASDEIIDPRRVCIVGASYGGYAALAGVTLQHDIYRCAVSVSGISDLAALMAVDSRVDADSERYFKTELGATFAGDPKLQQFSPLHQAEHASAPILLIYGTDDSVVAPHQSEWLATVLTHAGKSVQTVPLEKEDHWLSRAATRTQMLTASVAFVERYDPVN